MLPILILLLLANMVLLIWLSSNLFSATLGAPAITSPHHDFWPELAKRGSSILDLGCGNGSSCIAAAPYFKEVYGIEYSPFYYIVARLRTARHKNITIIYGSFWKVTWPKADLIYCYLLPDLLGKMKKLLRNYERPIASLAFPIPDWQPTETLQEGSLKLRLYYPHR